MSAKMPCHQLSASGIEEGLRLSASLVRSGSAYLRPTRHIDVVVGCKDDQPHLLLYAVGGCEQNQQCQASWSVELDLQPLVSGCKAGWSG